jgi:flavin prenyltransferase
MSDYVIGITGASGSIYGVRLIRELARKKHHVDVVITSAGKQVMKEELGASDFGNMEKLGLSKFKGNIKIWENDDFEAPFMSGSGAPEAVIIIPCSVGKLAAIANGISGNLIERTADVALKEKKPLILVVRETPFSLIHLENMVKVARAGAQILPAMPAFYHHPRTIDDMVNFIVGKVLNLLKIEHNLFKGWRKE